MAGFESKKQALRLRTMEFCGVDDSVPPGLLQVLSAKYSWVEWGVLFRDDVEGTPRFPSKDWVSDLSRVNCDNESIMRLSAHLCGRKCLEVLEGNFQFVEELHKLGFSRIQFNFSKEYSVDIPMVKYTDYSQSLRRCMDDNPEIEFVIKLDDMKDKSQPFYDVISDDPPANLSVLLPIHKSEQIDAYVLPPQPSDIPCGYAGGIGPENISEVLESVKDQTENITGSKPVWISMEDSLRVAQTDRLYLDQDVLSISKCFECIQLGEFLGLPVSRSTILTI